MRARHVRFHDRDGRRWSQSGVQNLRKSPLVAFWRPNPSPLSLLFSVYDARKLLTNFAWGARGPGFKSRRPDQIPQTLTRPQPQGPHQLGPNWVQFRSNLERGSSGSHGRHGGLPRLYSRITIRRRQEFPYTCKLRSITPRPVGSHGTDGRHVRSYCVSRDGDDKKFPIHAESISTIANNRGRTKSRRCVFSLTLPPGRVRD